MDGYNYENPDLEQDNPDLFFDFDEIEKDKDAASRALAVLRRATQAKNTITIDEFEKYKPLFMEGSRQRLGNKLYDSLCCDWRARVSIFHPMYIVTNDKKELLLTLPPIFQKQVPVNILGELGPQMVIGLANAFSSQSDDFNRKKKKYSSLTAQAYKAAQELIASENAQETELILRNFKQQKQIGHTPDDDNKIDFDSGEVEIL